MRVALASVCVVALCALAVAGGTASGALADGDPASDVLPTRSVFIPFGLDVSDTSKAALTKALATALKKKVKVKVAVISAPEDLGAIPSLFGKPQQYAKFLGTELSLVYKQRLLVVMPNGFGLFYAHKRTVGAIRALAKVKVQPGGDGLVGAATAAVQILAQRGPNG
jgi:hypothetical protein